MFSNIPSARYAPVAPIIMYLDVVKNTVIVFVVSIIFLTIFTKKTNHITTNNKKLSIIYTQTKDENNNIIFTVTNIDKNSFTHLKEKLNNFYSNFKIKTDTKNQFVIINSNKNIIINQEDDKIIITFNNIDKESIIRDLW